MQPAHNQNSIPLTEETIRPLRYPSDWPADGPIDLQLHDLPHASSTIEWWYQNTHLTSNKGQNFSLFASFFRIAIDRDEQTQEYKYAHSITWALCDADNQLYYMDSVVDRIAPQEGLKMIERGQDKTDKLLLKALKEVLEKGTVPLPDRLMESDGILAADNLDITYGANSYRKLSNGSYQLCLQNEEKGIQCELVFTPLVNPVRHGDNGVVVGTGGEDMFYYFIPECEVNGTITIQQEQHDVEGSGWYDHEFGKPADNADEKIEVNFMHDIAWNWISLQVSNGQQISVYDLFDNNNDMQSRGRWAVVIDADGQSRSVKDFTFKPLNNWTSSRTFTPYPVNWQLQIPELNIDLSVEAAFPHQEFVTIISKPAFWEGRVHASGVFNGEQVTGLGFIERSGFANVEKLEDFFKAVTKQTRKSVEELLPLQPTDEQFARLVASERNKHFLEGLDKEQYIKQIIQPIREIIDRGGKCWRSYAAIACIDVVGGNSQPYMNWLVWPELLHTGSLIIDDVQDRSEIRRGGPSCHVAHGEAIAINAGNACYFLGQILLLDDKLSDDVKLKAYQIYFETMRAAHAGQAMDISSFYHFMPSIVQSGDNRELEKKILAVHRLKSAVPASMLAQLGAIKGKAKQAQIDGLGNFFEALGLAFQIIDDVLNLRGFKGDLKDRGEDITAGKITMPVAKAMGLLAQPDREWLWQQVSSKPHDTSVIAEVIDLLEKCGAIDACEEQAEYLIEDAWKKLDTLIPDSDVKIRLRAFGWYVLRRHY